MLMMARIIIIIVLLYCISVLWFGPMKWPSFVYTIPHMLSLGSILSTFFI